MGRPRPRFTTRHLMILVALIAALLGGGEALRRRRDLALARMRHHEVEFANVMFAPEAILDFRRFKKYADHHLAMIAKWRQAARRPWRPFAPDPPPPE